MKRNVLKVTGLICAISILTLHWGCNKKVLTYNYEVKAEEQAQQGGIQFKVYSYAETVEEAIERAKMDAVHAVLFKGIPGSNLVEPMITDPDVEGNNGEFFKKFFGVDELANRTKEKKRYGSGDAPYRLYVSLSNDGAVSAKDRLKVNGGYKVGVLVIVNHKQLREAMEKEGIIRAFGL